MYYMSVFIDMLLRDSLGRDSTINLGADPAYNLSYNSHIDRQALPFIHLDRQYLPRLLAIVPICRA